MTEKILLVPGAVGTELIRMLARFGKNTLGLRIMNGTEFARFALMRSGIVLKERFLTRRQETAVIDGFVRDISYFASAGYADSEKIADALYGLRSLITEREDEQLYSSLPKGEFPEKNISLRAVYEQYCAALKAAGSIDTIGLLRKAMVEAKPLSCPVILLQEYPLTPLEDSLVKHLAAELICSSLPQLLERDIVPLRNVDYTESYGSSNEVEGVVDYIIGNRIPFDHCTVAVANGTPYAQLFYDLSQAGGLPISMGCGIPILNTNPARLLKLLYDWNNSGYHGVDALRALLLSDAMDRKTLFSTLGIESFGQLERLIELGGQLRLSFDSAENRRRLLALPQGEQESELYPCLTALAEELALGESGFVKKYAYIREGATGKSDRSALSLICDTLDSYALYADGSSSEQLIPELLQKTVCSENSTEGALFVTDISGALASMREHLFVVGMSASNFPGTPRENYLLLDSDYLLFAHGDAAPTSIHLIRRKKETLDRLLTLAAALDVKIHISYSGYDLVGLKEENPSSVLFELFKQQHGEGAGLQQYKDSFRRVGYFSNQRSARNRLGAAYMQGKEIICQEQDRSEEACAYTGEKAFSPTAIDRFFSCPRHFFLTSILGIREAEEDDPFTVIDPAAVGSLAHSLMEQLAHSPCDRDSFMQRVRDAFDSFLLVRPPIHRDSAETEKKTFCQMMENAYDMDPHNQVLASEEDQIVLHSSGVLLHGIPDRVEKTAEGEYIIADYKTGRSIRHKPNDIDTCLQVVIYAYLLEQHGIPISHCEYRYLRDSRVIPCAYDTSMREKLNDKLLEFKNALDTGCFPKAENPSACTYCTLAGLCNSEP
ncbi:MAG: PD-(D/E)XK nuclease family protein [Oscillospiraceae bacterium]|nr:PD-(D/E)XK nuclease family protein [Oscillospiraceae bacterium]